MQTRSSASPRDIPAVALQKALEVRLATSQANTTIGPVLALGLGGDSPGLGGGLMGAAAGAGSDSSAGLEEGIRGSAVVDGMSAGN